MLRKEVVTAMLILISTLKAAGATPIEIFQHIPDSGLTSLRDLAVDAAGNLYASGILKSDFSPRQPGDGALIVFSPDGAVSRLGGTLKESLSLHSDVVAPPFVVVGHDGHLPNRPGFGVPDGVFRIAGDGTTTRLFDITSGSGPMPLATDDAGNLYYPDFREGRGILKETPLGAITVFACCVHQPVDMTFDSAGNLLVADAELDGSIGSIVLISPQGRVRQLFRQAGIRPHYLARGPDGSIFFSSTVSLCVYDPLTNSNVCGLTQGDIFKLTADGTLIAVVSGLVQALGVAYDEQNDFLYMVDFLNFGVGLQQGIPLEAHNDTLILRTSGSTENAMVPSPFFLANYSPVSVSEPGFLVLVTVFAVWLSRFLCRDLVVRRRFTV
jgi:hypothetical protein